MSNNVYTRPLARLAPLALACAVFTGCAKSTDELGKTYVSPMLYEDYSCKQLRGEMARLTRRAQELTHSVNKNAQGDSIAMGVGLILFWPSLFFIDGDNPDAQEYMRVRGEYDAVEQSAIKQDCSNLPEVNPFEEAERQYKEEQAKEPKDPYPNRRRR